MKEITTKNYVKGREQFIVEKCTNKRVLHLGCCDTPYTKFVFDKQSSLFQRIEKVCESQLGLDNNNKGLDYIRSKGYSNLKFFDLNEPGEIDFIPEIIIFADTLEHLMNLESALSTIKDLMNKNVELIITVPNATMFERFIGNFRGYIHEHPDHKVSFTYTSLKQLMQYNNLIVKNIFLSDQLHIDHNRQKIEESVVKSILLSPIRLSKSILRKILVKFFPLFSECLICVCKIKL